MMMPFVRFFVLSDLLLEICASSFVHKGRQRVNKSSDVYRDPSRCCQGPRRTLLKEMTRDPCKSKVITVSQLVSTICVPAEPRILKSDYHMIYLHVMAPYQFVDATT